MMGGDGLLGKATSYSVEILVKGDSHWRLINGTFQGGWPYYSQTGITMNNKVYFLGILLYVNAN